MAFTDFTRPGVLRRNLVPAAVAVAIGAVAWVGIGPLLSGDEDAAPEAQPAVEAVVAEPAAPASDAPPAQVYPSVLVAKADIRPGVLLLTEHVEWREWRDPLDMALAVVQDVVPLRAVLGAVTRREFGAGELVSWDGLLMPGHPGFISAALSPGMLGVTIEVDRATTTANIIHPGDRVDVIMVTSGAASADAGAASRTIVRDTRVLAVGSTVLSLGRYGTVSLTQAGLVEPVAQPEGDNYTLEVRPQDAERIAVASTAGRLTLAMRSIRPVGAAATAAHPVRLDQVMPPPLQPDEPAPVRVLRGAEASAVVLDST